MVAEPNVQQQAPTTFPTTAMTSNSYLQSPLTAVIASSSPSSSSNAELNTSCQISSFSATHSVISTGTTIEQNAAANDVDETVPAIVSAGVPTNDIDACHNLSLTAAGTPRKREPVDPSRCIYPCECCGKSFTTKL